MDRVAAFMSERTPRRALALGTFLLVLWLFRHLAVLLVFFVAFERAIGATSRALAARTRLGTHHALLIIVVAFVAILGGLGALGVGRALRTVDTLREELPRVVADMRQNPLVARVQEQVGDTDSVVETAKHYAGDALAAASAVGHFLIHVFIAFILAVVYTLERDQIRAFWSRVSPRSLFGTTARWIGHVADAALVMLHLQIIVAVFNTVTTLPILLLLRVPHVVLLMVLVFVSALVPVVGNVVSGAILCVLAYQAKGFLGVGIFVALTFVLHKIESYYLNPRITAPHVHMPGFLLIVSLLLCEQLFGFKGFFLSFPILFVAGRIRREWHEDDAAVRAAPVVVEPAT